MVSARHVGRGLMAVTVVALINGSCSSSSAQPPTAGQRITVSLRDFKLSVSPTRVAAGSAVFSVLNDGPEDHEFIVVRSNAAVLPLRADGVTIDEETLEPTKIAALEPGQPGETRQLRVRLSPGHYTVFCNMAGHYLSGMHEDLVVT